MAYLSFSPWPADNGVAAITRMAATPADVTQFTRLELRVISHAERVDAIRELSYQSRLGRFLERMLGVKLGRPLANPRLESLRRFSSLASHHPEDLTEADVLTFVEAGFSRGQAHGLLAYLSADGRHSHPFKIA